MTKEIKRWVVSWTIFIVSIIFLGIGAILDPLPLCVIFFAPGSVGFIIGFIALGICLVEWWDKD